MVQEVKTATLPKQQLTILAICRFAEPVAVTSVNPYLPEMIQSFGVPIDQVAKYSGWLSACFSLAQCLLAIAWGRASDKFGRKPMILLALTCIMVSSVLFGLSRSLTMAFTTRSFQGLASGNVGIIRTAVAEMVPQRELQPVAFSIMPLVWNVGSIFGPTIGGSLVRPVERYPGIFKHFGFLEKYPFALPNLIISVFFFIGIASGLFFMRETHEDLKTRRDYGLVLGQLLTKPCTGQRQRKQRSWRHSSFSSSSSYDEQSEPFLDESENALSSPLTPRLGSSRRRTQQQQQQQQPPKRLPEPGWRSVFTYQSNINLLAYTGLATHNVAFDQIVPVFMNYPVSSSSNSGVDGQSLPNPINFSGGFGLQSPQIGLLFTIYGVFGMLVQFLVFPRVAKRYGVLRCFKVCALTFPVVYLVTPFTSLLPTNTSRQTVCLLLMLVKGAAGIFAFPCSTILLTNSASSLKILGTLNGVGTSVSAVGRALGPALAGAMFTIGVDAGYIVAPFWSLAVVAVIAAVPIWWLVEMEGFASSADASSRKSDDSDDGEETGLLQGDSDDDTNNTALNLNTTTSAAGSNLEGRDQVDVLARDVAQPSPSVSRTSRGIRQDT